MRFIASGDMATATEPDAIRASVDVRLLRWRRTVGCLAAVMFVAIMLTPGTTRAQTRLVELEISASPRAEVRTQQRWLEMLSEVGADRVRSKTSSVVTEPSVDEVEYGTTSVVKVTGRIQGSHLYLPGGRYSLNDRSAIRDYIQKLRDDGAKVALAEKKAFGLTSEQLVDVYGRLSRPVRSTKGREVADIVREVLDPTGLDWQLDDTARRVLRSGAVASEELEGISGGTALAAALRPLGLVLVPFRPQGEPVQIKIVDVRSADEHWPVGWPAERPLKEYAPSLFERQDVAIGEFPLDQALNAIQGRVKIPFLYDQNSLARAGIELSEVRVTYAREKAAYMVVVQKLLRQSKPRLLAEMRVDENDKPFLWISTASPTK